MTEAQNRFKHQIHEFLDGKIQLYKSYDSRLGRLNPNWFCKFKLPNAPRVRKSSHTPNLEEASRWAHNEILVIQSKYNDGLPVNEITFSKICDQYLVWLYGKKIQGDCSDDKYDRHKSTINLYLNKEFSDRKIHTIRELDIDSYLIRRKNTYGLSGNVKRKNNIPAGGTINKENIVLRSIFEHSKKLGYIKIAPKVNDIRNVHNRRPSFSQNEWTDLVNFLNTWIENSPGQPYHLKKFRAILRDFVELLGYSGLRVGEARNLRWSDIEFKKTKDGLPYVKLAVRGKDVGGKKTGARSVVAIGLAEATLKRRRQLTEFKLGDNERFFEDQNWVFAHPVGSPSAEPGNQIGSSKKAFRTLLNESELLFDHEGHVRTLYSLRHTYASLRLQLGEVDIYQLAKNMGTSVTMIERHYGHIVPEQFASNLARLIETEAVTLNP